MSGDPKQPGREPPPPPEPLDRSVRKRRERRQRFEREGEQSFLRGLAILGSVGWLIVVPLLGGIFIGRWLDGIAGQDLTWTLSLAFLGLVLGGWMVWRRLMDAEED